MKATKKIITTCALGLAGLLYFNQKEETSKNVLAEVGGLPVTEESFRFWWGKQPPLEDTSQTRQSLLNQLITRTSLAQKAREAGIDSDPAIVEAIESLLITKLKEIELQPKLAALEVTDEEARTFHETSPFQTPGRIHPAVLWLNSRGQAPLVERYQKRFELLTKSLNHTEKDFGKLALTNSEHRASRYRGGSLGWINCEVHSDPFKQAVVEIAATLQPGETSKVITREEGVFLVKLIERQAPQKPRFEDRLPSIKASLLSKKKQELKNEFEEAFASPDEVIIHEKRLTNLSDLPLQPKETDLPFNTRTAQSK